jgi:glycerophosphoryl diester phosphodiesterase
MRQAVIVLLAALAGCATPKETSMKWPTLDGKPPLIIAHRGASGYLPEHTVEAYALAIEQGADVVEPDLVFTKDGVLIARHDRYLSTTTNVADKPEFATRKRANADPKTEPREDWWVEDFTLAEMKTLRARQPFPGRSKEHDDKLEIPTFVEMLTLVSAKAKEAGRPVGVYPETKHPAFFASIGRDFEGPLLTALQSFDAGPVFIQSFEPEILKRLKGKTNANLVQLVYEKEPGAGPNIPLAEIATYADGVAAAKNLILAESGEMTSFVQDAHAHELTVHAWTFRDDAPDGPAVLGQLRKRKCADGGMSKSQCADPLVIPLFIGRHLASSSRGIHLFFGIRRRRRFCGLSRYSGHRQVRRFASTRT